MLRLHKWVNKSWGTMKIEKVVELKPYRGGLKITAGNEKSPKPLENKEFWTLVPQGNPNPNHFRLLRSVHRKK